MTLVSALREWLEENRDRLEALSVSITDRLPSWEENEQGKGNIGLAKGHILVSLTVWNRSPISQELIVYNTHTDKTIIMDDTEEVSVKSVIGNLQKISEFLVSGRYDDLASDENLSIT